MVKNRYAGGNRGKRAEPTPQEPTPQADTMADADPQTQQYRLASYTLDAVDQLTGMTADEIDVVADRLLEGARETEDVLRELAHRVREYGVIANERLANFVNVANGCTEAARTMRANLELRDEQPAAASPAATPAQAPEPEANGPHDLDSLETDIQSIAAERAPPTQPGD